MINKKNIDVCFNCGDVFLKEILKTPCFFDIRVVENKTGVPFEKNTIVFHKELPELVPRGFCSSQGVFVDLKKEIKKRDFGKKEDPLIKSVGKNNHVFDGTAGFGVDTVLISLKNKSVFCFEKDPLVFLFLKSNLLYLKNTIWGKKIKVENTCVLGFGGHGDVLYIDPMFPPKKKKALPPQRIQWLRGHLGEPELDMVRFLDFGRSRFKKVVLKRPNGGLVVGKPSGSVSTKSVRYDIYAGI